MSDQLTQAIALAADVHAGQIDKGGDPYILHPLRVMQSAMAAEKGSPVVGIAAVLHDVIEDNEKYSLAELRKRIGLLDVTDRTEDPPLPPSILVIDVLTKADGEDYFDYIKRIIEFGSYAVTIKMMDLDDNLNIRRQPTLQDKDLQRLLKYHMAYRMLRDAR